MRVTFDLILILLITPQPVTPIFPLLVGAITAAYSAYQILNDAHDTYMKVTTKSTNDIYDQVADLSNNLDQVEQRISAKLDDIYGKLMTELPRAIDRNAALNDLAKKIARVDHWYKKFEKLYRNKKGTMNRKAYGFAKLATSDKPGHLLDIFNEIKEDVLPEETKNLRTGLLDLIVEGTGNSKDTVHEEKERWPCNVQFGEHGPAFSLYKTLLMTEMKGAIMVGISFVMRGYYEKENYLPELEYEQENMIERTQAYMEGLSKTELVKQRSTRHCEPSTKYINGYNYFEFMGFQTAYLVNQMDMFDPPSCNPRCDLIENLVTHQHSCENSKCSEQDKCHGHITNCTETFASVRLCKPGRFMPEAHVEDSEHPEDFLETFPTINWPETLENKRIVYYAKTDDGELKRLEERKDYGLLTVNENIINLDDILVPTHYAVTGVRFNYKKVDTGPAPIQLEVRATPCDYLTGKLIMDEENPSIWLTSEDMKGRLPDYDRNREEINIPLNTDPRSHTGKSKWIANPNYFVSVKASKPEVAAGQLVLPLMHIEQEPPKEKPYTLGDVGLSYRAHNRDTAGFLFIRLYEFDWVSALQFPNVEDKYDDIDENEKENKNDTNQGQNEDE